MKTISDPANVKTLSSAMRNSYAVFILCLSIFVCYFNSSRNGFVADDHFIIELNDESLGFQSAIAAFTSSDKLVNSNVSPYYRPLTRASFLLDRYFFGLNPAGYHGVNILLHAACVVLLYFALLRLECGFTVSFGASVLFAVHPVNAEAVNFISARNTILASLFVLGSLLTYLKAEEIKKRRGYLLSGFLFFLALLSKETSLMLIPFLIFLKIYREQSFREPSRILKWDTTFVLFHTVFLGIYLLLRLFAIDNSFIHDHFSDLSGRLRHLIYIVPKYFSLAVVPRGLTFWHIVPTDYRTVMLPLLFKWFALSAAMVYMIKKRSRTTDIGFAWLIINSIPISTIVPIPSASMAERYLYLPIIGFLVILVESLVRLFDRKKHDKLPIVVISLLAIILCTITVNKNLDWRDNLSLDKNVVDVNPFYPFGHFDLGYELYLRGDRTTAEKEFKKALDLDPRLPQATWIYYYLGTLSVESYPGIAEHYFLESTKADPRNSTAQYALATLLNNKDRKAAIKAYDKFLAATALPSYHLVTEVRNNVSALTKHLKTMPFRSQYRSGDYPSDRTWAFIYHYPSGTELFYKVSSIREKANNIKIMMEQRLTNLDKDAYAMRLIRFPLSRAAKARFVFNIKCHQHMTMMTSMEFLDNDGIVLGNIWPEKEYTETYYEYLLPNTIMRSFSENICTNY